MFPQIPYHNIGKAHRLLMKELPETHPYRMTLITSYATGMGHLLKKTF
jgi:fatty acid desaturase